MLTRPAVPLDFAAASSMVGYPPKMLRRAMPGLVNIRLAIDESGRVTACRIQMPLSDPEFESSSCADIQHAFEFEPALDKDGKPIASYWITRVHFEIGR
jgi:TonB family protein